MKEFIAESGGRYAYADDVLNLQEMAQSLASLFTDCSNFIISGCVPSGVTITPGYVWINGKVRRYEGCAGALYPYYIYEKNSNETVAYANEVNKRGRACYMAVGGVSVPTVADPVTGLVPQFIRITPEYTPRLADQFFGHYALMTDSPFVRQTVHKDLLFTGTLAVEKGIESKHSLIVAPQANGHLLRCRFSEVNTSCIEACKNAVPAAGVYFNGDRGDVTIRSKGCAPAYFTGEISSFVDLQTEKFQTSHLYIERNYISNITERQDHGTIHINYDGFQHKTDYFRDLSVYDGKRCAVPLLQVEGSTGRVNIGATLGVEASRGIEITDSVHGAAQVAYVGRIGWKDKLGVEMAQVGYTSAENFLFTITSTAGDIAIRPKAALNIEGELLLRGVALSATYATQAQMNTALSGKVDTVVGKGLSAQDFTVEFKAKLEGIADGDFDGSTSGYVTAAQVRTELDKKAARLLDGLDASQKQTAAANLGVYTCAGADAKFAATGSQFQDYITALVATGKSTDEAQQLLRDKLAAAGRKELIDGYMRRDQKLMDLTLANVDEQRAACRHLGAAFGADYQPVVKDTGWLRMLNSGSGTDTSQLYVRQIGSIVSIQGKINTAKRDGGNIGGTLGVLPNPIDPPKYGLRKSMADFNDDHKYNRGASFFIYGGDRKLIIHESGWYNAWTEIHFTYFV